MKLKNKKGFTLIELLAVIVILAIIALIATPIILGIIKDSKEESNKRSIEGYAKAVENSIAKSQLNTNESVIGKFESNTDGTKLSQNSEEKLKVEYEGNVVCSTIEVYEDGMFYLAGCKVNGDGEYTYGTKQKGPLCMSVTEETKTLGNVPSGNFEPGDEYICEVKDGVEYHFFVIGTKGNTVSLILNYTLAYDPDTKTGILHDRDLPLATEYYSVKWLVGDDNSLGPISAMDFLWTVTKDWKNVPDIKMDYIDEGGNYGTIKTEGAITTIRKKDGTPTAEFENLKARLPEYKELIGEKKCNSEGSDCPSYLDNKHYWLLSSCAGDQFNAYKKGDRFQCEKIETKDEDVRPVIEVPKTSLR